MLFFLPLLSNCSCEVSTAAHEFAWADFPSDSDSDSDWGAIRWVRSHPMAAQAHLIIICQLVPSGKCRVPVASAGCQFVNPSVRQSVSWSLCPSDGYLKSQLLPPSPPLYRYILYGIFYMCSGSLSRASPQSHLVYLCPSLFVLLLFFPILLLNFADLLLAICLSRTQTPTEMPERQMDAKIWSSRRYIHIF